jgi:opacity protein-like surface antigen
MKKTFLIYSLLLSIIAVNAFAKNDEFYGRVDAGYLVNQGKITGSGSKTLNTYGLTTNIGFGYYPEPNIRTDINLNYAPARSTKIKDSSNASLSESKLSVESYGAILNAYYDIGDAELKPYVTIGAGAIIHKAKIKGSVQANLKRKTAFAAQVGLGASYELSSKLAVDLGYRFTGVATKKSSANSYYYKPAHLNHSFLIGGRFKF